MKKYRKMADFLLYSFRLLKFLYLSLTFSWRHFVSSKFPHKNQLATACVRTIWCFSQVSSSFRIIFEFRSILLELPLVSTLPISLFSQHRINLWTHLDNSSFLAGKSSLVKKLITNSLLILGMQSFRKFSLASTLWL